MSVVLRATTPACVSKLALAVRNIDSFVFVRRYKKHFAIASVAITKRLLRFFAYKKNKSNYVRHNYCKSDQNARISSGRYINWTASFRTSASSWTIITETIARRFPYAVPSHCCTLASASSWMSHGTILGVPESRDDCRILSGCRNYISYIAYRWKREPGTRVAVLTFHPHTCT